MYNNNKAYRGEDGIAEPKWSSAQSLGVSHSHSNNIVFRHSRRRIEIALVVLCVFLLMACIILAILLAFEITREPQTRPETTNNTKTAPQICGSQDCLRIASEVKKKLNESVNPCDNFFHYACDGWIKDNPIPASETEYVTFLKLMRENAAILRNLLNDFDKNAVQDPNDAVLKTVLYYKSCMDEDEVERTAREQLLQLIRQLGSWAIDADWNEKDWHKTEALLNIQLYASTKSPLFQVEVVEDPHNSSKYLMKITLPSLALIPSQYDTTSEDGNKTIQAYLAYMTEVGKLLGGNQTTREQMEGVLALEKKIAMKTPPKKDLVGAKSLNVITVKQLETIAPEFPWKKHLSSLFNRVGVGNITDDEVINVPAPDFLKSVGEIFRSASKRDLSNYFIWKIIRELIPFLSRPFREADERYRKSVLRVKSSSPRWFSCIRTTQNYRGLTFAVGYLYIDKVFDHNIIPKVTEMMHSIREAFDQEVAELPWIDNITRPAIYDKLIIFSFMKLQEKYMVEKIGYPQMCVNKSLLNSFYKLLKVDQKKYLLNEVNVTRWYTYSILSRLRRPADKDLWYQGPQAVNAFYERSKNEINVLAGILRTPFFHGVAAPRAVNFGGIGMVLAHELTHGFDNVGRLYNKYGEIGTQWWTNFTLEGFKNRSKCIVDQYSAYSVDINGKNEHLDGCLTLGENIADNAGLLLAHRAYHNWVEKNGPEALIPSLGKTNEQMFFISYGQMWCSDFTASAKLRRLYTDTHSFPMFRVNGVVSNMPQFSKAFNCPIGSKMNPIPEHRCRVW